MNKVLNPKEWPPVLLYAAVALGVWKGAQIAVTIVQGMQRTAGAAVREAQS